MKGGTRRSIELDYGMVNGEVEITTKVCLSAYMERHFGLDRDPSTVPPSRQQIVPLNREEVDGGRRRAACAARASTSRASNKTADGKVRPECGRL
jgi:hypothetical protein